MQNVKSSKGFKVNPRKPKFPKNKEGLSKKLVISSSIPSAYVTRTVTRQPIYRARNDGSVDIKHKEMFLAIPGNTSWSANTALKSWDINPGNALLFPWLARVATAYEKYKFKKFVVTYVPNVGTSTAGNISMAIDFDPSDSAPASLIELMSYDGATQTQPFGRGRMQYPQKKLNSFANSLFVAKQGSSGNEPRTSFMGKLFVATDTTAVAPGFLHVSYEINLSIPEGRSSSDLIYDRFQNVDPLALSSRRFTNTPAPEYVARPYVNYGGILERIFDVNNSRWNTKMTNVDSGGWTLAIISAIGTGLGVLGTAGLSSCKNLSLRYATQSTSTMTDRSYYIYFKRTDPQNESEFRVDLWDVTTTLTSLWLTYQSVTAQQAQIGMPDLHGALNAYTSPS